MNICIYIYIELGSIIYIYIEFDTYNKYENEREPMNKPVILWLTY